jgi:diguanylate cyclase (GGDEF)-like protein
VAAPPPARGPSSRRSSGRAVVDVRSRWRLGQLVLAAAGLAAVAALFRPLRTAGQGRLALAMVLVLAAGVSLSALLTSLKGARWPEALALYAFLVLSADAFAQLSSPYGVPAWPLTVVLVVAVSVAEDLGASSAVAALAALLAFAEAAQGLGSWTGAMAAAAGYGALPLAAHASLRREKRRLGETLARLARLELGLDALEEAAEARPLPGDVDLRQLSPEGRRSRRLDRAQELDVTLARAVGLARRALRAHAVLFFEIDRARDAARLRAAEGPPALLRDAVVPATADPFAFVLERDESFYATDFPRLLSELPWYRAPVKVGTLLAVPVRAGAAVAGVLVAERLETQALTGSEPELLAEVAGLLADAMASAHTALAREELGQEFKAAYVVSRRLAAQVEAGPVRRLLLRSARSLVPFEAAAVVTRDDDTRYTVRDAVGWVQEFRGREVALLERTWAAWVLKGEPEAVLIEDVQGRGERMPVFVLEEPAGRVESLLAVPLRARNRTLGALVLAGRRGGFGAAALRVLGILCNQAAATLSVIQEKEKARRAAVRDGLTGLFNRRAFDELLGRTLARESRQNGRFALVLLDVDHFKRLNDAFGHRAGDHALKETARLLRRQLRRQDEAARFGGEEFAAILPGTDAAGAEQLGERIRHAVEAHQSVFEGARLSVTVSAGAAVWPADGADEAALLAAADRALYAAKAAGRNRVVLASSLPREAPTSSA